MLKLVGAQLRRRAVRAAALFTGILVATTGFTILTGSVATSKLQVTKTVDANFRAAYDILVRPKAQRSPAEAERDLVRPNSLSGQYGGITTDQWAQIRQIDGVEVAAPIAMLGYASTPKWDVYDLTDYVDRTKTQQVLRLNLHWSSDRGLTNVDDAPHYVYVTKNPIISRSDGQEQVQKYMDGSAFNGSCPGPLEVLPSGKKVPICGTLDSQGMQNGVGEGVRSWFYVFRLRPDGTFEDRSVSYVGPSPKAGEPRLRVSVGWWAVAGVAAIDPEQEVRLVGLDRAIVDGRYLRPDDKMSQDQYGGEQIPMIVATDQYSDEAYTVGIDRLPGSAVRPSAKPAQQRQIMKAAESTHLGTLTQADTHNGDYPGLDKLDYTVDNFLQAGETTYAAGPGATLAPQPVGSDPMLWIGNVGISDGNAPPVFASDTAFRDVRYPAFRATTIPRTQVVGRFDASRLQGFSPQSAVPMETYEAPEATGADDASRRLLGDKPLRPNGNPAGYLSRPPLVLTTLTAWPQIFAGSGTTRAPISAVRVRVGGIEHFDELTRERVRRIAEEITLRTGLDVDITLGSSPAPQTIDLPAGTFGRPELQLTERWSKKGVALAIISAVDRKSAILFGLILGVCLLFLLNATTAAVRDRRRELAILAGLGWPRRRLAGLVVTEVALLGLAAGITSAALSLPLSALADVSISLARAAAAIPIATVLAVLAGVVPALRASSTHPAAALGPAGLGRDHRHWMRPRTVFGLAVRNATRLRGRSLLGVLAMALGVGGLTVVAALQWAFHGQITGNLLGDAVSVRVRGVDTVAVIATVILAAAAVADVLYLNVRERSAELATLRATGWSDTALSRLVAYEGLLIGGVGAAAGAGLGLAAVGTFLGTVGPDLVRSTIAAGLIGILLAAVAAIVPALTLRRIPLAVLLAEE